MKVLASQVMGFKINCLDGFYGKVFDFYFDYATWEIVYLSVSDKWNNFFYTKLIPVEVVKLIDFEKQTVDLKILSHQIRNGPDVKRKKSIKSNLYKDYWEHYYAVPIRPNSIKFSGPFSPVMGKVKEKIENDLRYSPLSKIYGYEVRGINNIKIGKVNDGILDFKDYVVSALIAKKRNIIFSTQKKVRVDFIRAIDWKNKKISVELDIEALDIVFNPKEKSSVFIKKVSADLEGQFEVDSRVKKIFKRKRI